VFVSLLPNRTMQQIVSIS